MPNLGIGIANSNDAPLVLFVELPVLLCVPVIVPSVVCVEFVSIGPSNLVRHSPEKYSPSRAICGGMMGAKITFVRKAVCIQ